MFLFLIDMLLKCHFIESGNDNCREVADIIYFLIYTNIFKVFVSKILNFNINTYQRIIENK